MLRTHEAGTLRADHAGQTVTLTGWVARRRDHGGVAFLDLRDASGVAQVVVRDEVLEQGGAHDLRNEYCIRVVGEVERAPRGQRQPRPAHRRHRGARQRDRGAQRLGAAAVPDRRTGHRRRGGPAQAPLPRPAPPGCVVGRCGDPAAVAGQRRGPLGARRSRLRRDRDPHPDPVHPRGCPRLPRARAAGARLLVRPAAEPAAVQAAAHGRRDGALLPDRALLPRRGLPRRPPARVHPARHRDVLRRAGRRARARRGDRRARSGSSSGSSCRRRSCR